MTSQPNPQSSRFARHPLASLLVASLSLSAGCKSASATAPELIKQVPVEVATEAASPVDTPRTLRLTGTLRGARETDLAANVAGRVLSIGFQRGQPIAKNAVIAQIDVRSAALALAEARVAVQNSKLQGTINDSECARYEQLRASGVVAELEFDKINAKCKANPLNIQAAEARQSIAAKNVGDGVIRAPFSGVVTERFVEVGEYVQASSRVISIAEVEDLKLELSLPEQNFPDVKQGAEVSFRVGAYTGQLFAGKVQHISGAVRESRDVLVEALVQNPDKKLLPGMFADVELAIGQEALPSVPKSATFAANGKTNVFVLKDGRLEQRVLQPAPAVGDRIPVRRGVELGEQVVTAYAPELKNGQLAQ
ncbi:MAG TPA: efflux RND transporter periplasmic adaptor subunit [Polyangiaceae bacterium]